MIVFPAIDLMDGQVVRLRQGRADERTVYSKDPLEVARRWEQQGAEWLHLVDLDGAFSGQSENLNVIRAVAAAVGIPCQMGGGLRTKESVAAALAAGVKRVILGSKACESIDFVGELVDEFGTDHIAVGIDARDGLVAVKGWTETTPIQAVDLARSCARAGVKTVIYTDVATDGMLQGPNLPAIGEMTESFPGRVIASGGVSSAADLDALRAIPLLHGVIVGKALYDERVRLADLIKPSPAP